MLPPIGKLGLNTRTINALRRYGITTTEQLLACTPEDVLEIREFGRVLYDKLVAALAVHGLQLAVGPIPAKYRDRGELRWIAGGSIPDCSVCARFISNPVLREAVFSVAIEKGHRADLKAITNEYHRNKHQEEQ